MASIISAEGVINAIIGGKKHSLQPDSPYYREAVTALRTEDSTLFLQAIDRDTVYRKKSDGKITLSEDGVVCFGGQPINNLVTKRIESFIRLDLPIDPLLKFLEKTLQNPKETAVDELYRFLETNELPITSDGNFLGWKRVRSDFKDFHSGTMDNSVGKVVKMPREEVDDNSEETCSSGLHLCSRKYLDHFHAGSGVIVLIEVNPRDVVSVPADYEDTKMRVCEYRVTGMENSVIAVDAVEETFQGNPVATLVPKRDSKGRFIKGAGQTPKPGIKAVSAPVRGPNGRFVSRKELDEDDIRADIW